MFRIVSLSIFIVLFSSFAFGQDQKLQVNELKSNFYMISGGGGNMLLYNNVNGPILIDDSFAPIYPELSEIIEDKCEQEVKYLINTHWHGDHTGGNEAFGALEELEIIAHDAVRRRLKSGGLVEFLNNQMEPAEPVALPDITFDSSLTFHLDETKIELIHFEHAHTDGDIIVHFPEQNVIHLGDLYFQGQFPFLDHSSGGTYLGLISALRSIMPMINDETIIIPGHGEVSNKEELKAYSKMVEQVFAIVGKMNAEGSSADEIANSEMMLKLDKIWNKGFITNKSITQLMLNDFVK